MTRTGHLQQLAALRRAQTNTIGPKLASSRSSNDLVGQRNQGRRERNADRVGGLEVDYQIELGRVLDRQVARFGASQYAVNVRRKTQRSRAQTQQRHEMEF